MTKTRISIENAYYHIYARGNQKQKIFIEKSDFEFYLERLKHYKIKYSFYLYAYCLMPNHLHLMGKPSHPEKLSNLMQCLQRSYTAYYNKKYEKVGHLWQGKFKTKIIVNDQYALECISYIEQNPLRAKLVKSSQDYIFSSYLERCFDYKTGFLNQFSL